MTRAQKMLIARAWNYLYDNYGCCEDICGDICNTWMFIELLRGETTKTDCMASMLQRYYDTGSCEGEIPKSDIKAQNFFNRLLQENIIR